MINKLIVGILPYLPEGLVWIFSKRYIAGKDLKDAVRVTTKLNKMGVKASMDLLGEFQTRAEMIDFYKQEYLRLIDASVTEQLDNSFSVKPTMFGLLLDEELCYRHIREIVAKAASFKRFVRIDMEDSQCVDREIILYKKLLEEFPGHVGIVLQAYLKRTMSDLEDLAAFDRGRGLVNVRICKGIYNEPAEVAYKSKGEINQHFLLDLDFMFRKGICPAIATHDKKLVTGAYRLIDIYQPAPDRFEFQMLYGVTPDLRKSIVEKGYTMRVYVPYGKDWYNYSTRRLKENPTMAFHIIKALFFQG
ncbi:MAG: proline dehydrogenase family protein [Bacteroidales bacterium]|nr:proline dehydrogenase family protein [Bacteroidales bacterium]